MRASDAITVPSSAARLRWVALFAAALLTAYGEFELATHVGFTPWLAWLLPIALDVYAYCAFAINRRADVLAALILMIFCQAIAHLLVIGIIPAHWTLVIAVSVVPPVICWRIHNLVHQPAADHAPAPAPSVSASASPNGDAAAAGSDVPDDVVPAARPLRRPIAQTRELAAGILAAEPEITREEIAERLGITPRRLRTILNAA